MSAYIGLLAAGRVRLQPLIDATFSIDRASEAYRALEDPSWHGP